MWTCLCRIPSQRPKSSAAEKRAKSSMITTNLSTKLTRKCSTKNGGSSLFSDKMVARSSGTNTFGGFPSEKRCSCISTEPCSGRNSKKPKSNTTKRWCRGKCSQPRSVRRKGMSRTYTTTSTASKRWMHTSGTMISTTNLGITSSARLHISLRSSTTCSRGKSRRRLTSCPGCSFLREGFPLLSCGSITYAGYLTILQTYKTPSTSARTCTKNF